VRFGWEDNSELEARVLPAGQKGSLSALRHSFLGVEPRHVVAFTLKPAEEEGTLLRLWECSGRDCEAEVDVSGLGVLRAACSCDHLERDGQPLPLVDGRVKVSLPARGLASVRLTGDGRKVENRLLR
jgi:hypothetical protein